MRKGVLFVFICFLCQTMFAQNSTELLLELVKKNNPLLIPIQSKMIEIDYDNDGLKDAMGIFEYYTKTQNGIEKDLSRTPRLLIAKMQGNQKIGVVHNLGLSNCKSCTIDQVELGVEDDVFVLKYRAVDSSYYDELMYKFGFNKSDFRVYSYLSAFYDKISSLYDYWAFDFQTNILEQKSFLSSESEQRLHTTQFISSSYAENSTIDGKLSSIEYDSSRLFVLKKNHQNEMQVISTWQSSQLNFGILIKDDQFLSYDKMSDKFDRVVLTLGYIKQANNDTTKAQIELALDTEQNTVHLLGDTKPGFKANTTKLGDYVLLEIGLPVGHLKYILDTKKLILRQNENLFLELEYRDTDKLSESIISNVSSVNSEKKMGVLEIKNRQELPLLVDLLNN